MPGLPLTGPDVRGSALLQLMEPDRPGVVQVTARLEGLSRDTSHSFHFHTWGDMTVDYTELGDIYSANSIKGEVIPSELSCARFTILYTHARSSLHSRVHLGQ